MKVVGFKILDRMEGTLSFFCLWCLVTEIQGILTKEWQSYQFWKYTDYDSRYSSESEHTLSID